MVVRYFGILDAQTVLRLPVLFALRRALARISSRSISRQPTVTSTLRQRQKLARADGVRRIPRYDQLSSWRCCRKELGRSVGCTSRVHRCRKDAKSAQGYVRFLAGLVSLGSSIFSTGQSLQLFNSL